MKIVTVMRRQVALYCLTAQRIQIVGPPLEHGPALLQIRSMIIGPSDGVLLFMGKLSFNNIAVKAPFQFLFVEYGGKHGPETVDGHFFLAESHSPNTVQ